MLIIEQSSRFRRDGLIEAVNVATSGTAPSRQQAARLAQRKPWPAGTSYLVLALRRTVGFRKKDKMCSWLTSAGSVLHPAGHAGVVGLKPTVGLTSRDGVIPGSHNRDSVGAFAKNVHDAALLLDAMYGPDDNDPLSLAQVGKTPDDGYAQSAVDSSALKGAVFGIPYPIWWSTVAGIRAPGNEAKMLARLEELRAAGAIIVNMTEPLPYAYEIQNSYGWGDAVNTSYWLQSARYLNVDLCNDYTGWLKKLSWPNGTTGGLPMENLGDMVV
jgi:amidase